LRAFFSSSENTQARTGRVLTQRLVDFI